MNFKRFCVSFACLLILSLWGCKKAPVATTEPPQATESPVIYTYTEEYLREEEPLAGAWLVSGNQMRTEADGIVYYFAPTISEEDRAAFITAQTDLSDLLRKSGVPADGLRICVLPDYTGLAVSDTKTAYIGMNALQTPDQILTTLSALWSEYTNYGYLTALADYLAAELEWQSPADTDFDAKLFNSDPTLLNLSYPCFAEYYSDQSTVTACRALANRLLEDMSDPLAGEGAFLNCAKAYAAQQGINFTPTAVDFAYTGRACRLKIRTDYMEVFIVNDYVAGFQENERAIADDALNSFASMVDYFETLNTEIAVAAEAFSIQDITPLPVYFTENIADMDSFKLGGYFTANNNEPLIYARTPYCLLHEYVHYLYYCHENSFSTAYEGWHNEVLAYYYAREETVRERILWMSYQEAIDYDAHFEGLLGHPYRTAEDEIELTHIAIPYQEQPLYALKTSHMACLSYAAYFVSEYGEETLITCMITPEQAPDLIGKTVDETVDDWLRFIEQNYSSPAV